MTGQTEFKRGDRLSAGLLNEVIPNMIPQLDGGSVGNASQRQGTIQLSEAVTTILPQEPATEALWANIGQDDIPLGAPIPILGSNNVTGLLNIEERILGGADLRGQAAGRVVVAAENIKKGAVGRVYIGGICLIVLDRWFESKAMTHAVPHPTKAAWLSAPGGDLTILWEERKEDGSAFIDNTHWAIARIGEQQNVVAFEQVSGVAEFGEGLVVDAVNQADGLTTGGELLALTHKTSAIPQSRQFVSLSADVADLFTGRAVRGPALVRVDYHYQPGIVIGPNVDDTGFSAKGSGWRVIQHLGQFPVDADPKINLWAAVEPDDMPTASMVLVEDTAHGLTPGDVAVVSSPTALAAATVATVNNSGDGSVVGILVDVPDVDSAVVLIDGEWDGANLATIPDVKDFWLTGSGAITSTVPTGSLGDERVRLGQGLAGGRFIWRPLKERLLEVCDGASSINFWIPVSDE